MNEMYNSFHYENRMAWNENLGLTFDDMDFDIVWCIDGFNFWGVWIHLHKNLPKQPFMNFFLNNILIFWLM